MISLKPFDFSIETYEVMAEIHRSSWSDSAMRGEDYKRIDDYTPVEEYDWERMLLCWNDKIVGFGIFGKALWLSTPDLYFFGILVHPEYRGRGLANAYMSHFETAGRPNRTIDALMVSCRTDAPEGIRFAEKHGFVEQHRYVKSELDLAQFDPAKFEDVQTAVSQKRIQIVPLSDLMEREDTIDQLLELEWVLVNDEPHEEPPKRNTAEMFRNYYIDHDKFHPDGWFIALKNDKFIGWSAVFPNVVDHSVMQTGITVIDRPYRRIGLATAMKATGLAYAKALGKAKIVTSNSSLNPMLELNKSLGFVTTYSSVEMKKKL